MKKTAISKCFKFTCSHHFSYLNDLPKSIQKRSWEGGALLQPRRPSDRAACTLLGKVSQSLLLTPGITPELPQVMPKHHRGWGEKQICGCACGADSDPKGRLESAGPQPSAPHRSAAFPSHSASFHQLSIPLLFQAACDPSQAQAGLEKAFSKAGAYKKSIS